MGENVGGEICGECACEGGHVQNGGKFVEEVRQSKVLKMRCRAYAQVGEHCLIVLFQVGGCKVAETC